MSYAFPNQTVNYFSGQNLRLTPVAFAVAVMLNNTAGAAEPVSTAKPAAEEPVAVQITGIRASKQASLAAKRNSDSVVEVVSAEDIGKMPDKNVADALQRLPGITTATGTGGTGGYDENDRVSMRGTPASMSIVTLNGHSIATADWDYGDMLAGGAGLGGGSTRSVSFLLLPSQIVSRAVVHKSAQADDPEGGVAGSIDIITRRPLEFKKPVTVEIAAGGVYTDRAGKVSPQVSGLFNWKNEANDLGVMAQVFDETRKVRRDGQTFTWGTLTAAQAAGINNAIPAGTVYLNQVTNNLFEQTRRRRGGVLGLQWKPSNTLTLGMDAFYSQLDASVYRQSFTSEFGSAISNKIVPTNVVVENGLLKSASFAGGGTFNSNSMGSSYNPGAQGKTGYVAADFKWQATEDLKLDGQAGRTRGHGNAEIYEKFQNFSGVGNQYLMSGLNEGVARGLPTGINDSNRTFNRGDDNYSLADSTDQETFAQLNGEWSFQDSILNSVKFGWRGADHERKTVRTLKAGWPEDPTGTTQVSTLPHIAWENSTFPNNFGTGLGGGGNAGASTFPTVSPEAVKQWTLSNLSTDPVFNKPAGGPFRVGEKSQALYLMGKLAGEQWRANVGLRYARTNVSITTNTGLSCGVAGTKAANGQTITYGSPLQASECANFVPAGATLTTGTRFNNFYTQTTENSYDKLLPSFNLTWDASKDLVFRAGAARTMARPEYSALGTSIGNFQYNPAAAIPSTASGGNQNLGPIVARNFNLTGEWYFKPRSAITAQLFLIDFESMIGAGSSTQNLFNTAFKDSNGVLKPAFVDTVVSQPVMVKGKSKGIELGYEQPLWGGFGWNANYTYANSKEESGLPMIGSAKNSGNIGIYYEDSKFNARLNYSTRSETRVGLFGAQQSFAAPTKNLSASFGYTYDDHLSFTVELLNLNNPVLRYYNKAPGTAVEEQNTALYNSGRQLYFGLRYKM